MNDLHIDFETRSPVDIRKHGVYRYMLHPQTRPLFCTYKFGGEPGERWDASEPCPQEVIEHVKAGGIVKAHNAGFERLLWQYILTPRYGWPEIRLEQFVCTAATAAALSLPRDLAGLGAALGLPVQKNTDGYRLIRKFSLPRKARKGEDPEGLYWNEPEDHPEDWERFKAYCDDDVETEYLADCRMVPLSVDELNRYYRSERINDRGIRVDVVSAHHAIRLADKAKALLDREMTLATGGYVTACSQVARLTEWVAAQGVEMSSAAKADIEELLDADDVPERVRKALLLRQEAAKTSVSKLASFLDRVCDDGRIRGAYLFRAAGTGRYSSTGAQLHNMPRPRKEFMEAELDMRLLFQAIRTEDPEYLKFLYGDELGRTLWLLSDAIRGFILAKPGHDLVVSDYSGIEGAVAAWFCGEDWKVKALFEIMADDSLPDLYRRTAAGIYDTTTEAISKKDPRRQVGKVAELACLSGDTQVLTSNGVKSIMEVSCNDLLWDGVEWIHHGGVVLKGVKPVVDVDGIEVTEDHLIKTGVTWTPAGELASDQAKLDRALVTGSETLPSRVLHWGRMAACAASRRRVSAVTSARTTYPTYETVGLLAVKHAAEPRKAGRGRPTWRTMMSSLMKVIEDVCSTESPLAYLGAPTRTTLHTKTTAAAAYASTGAETGAPSCSTSPACLGGTSRALSSTVSTSTADTSLAICGSSPKPRTPPTAEKPASCKPESQSLKPVYDILNAGPRHRFTVFSRSGALLVHNCQYQGGVAAFYAMARGYNLQLGPVFGPLWDAADEERQERAVKRYEECLARKEHSTQVLSREEWLAAELVKVGWRATNPAICASWRLLEDAVWEAVSSPGTVVSVLKVKYIVRSGFLFCLLPSGRCLAYGSPRIAEVEVPWADKEQPPEKREKKATVTVLGVNSQTRKFVRYPLYGGILLENKVQAIALDLLENGIEKAEEANYPVILHVHDEIGAEVPRGFGDVKEFEQLICQLPVWAEGLPLTSGGWRGKRYRKD